MVVLMAVTCCSERVQTRAVKGKGTWGKVWGNQAQAPGKGPLSLAAQDA